MRPSPPSSDSSGVAASHVQAVPRNCDTIFPPAIHDVAGELARRLEQEQKALSRHFGAPASDGVPLAARIALIGPRDLELRELVADPDAFVVVGRHSEASVRALGAASLSLRHVLLIPQPTASGPKLLVDIVPLAPTVRLAAWTRPLPAPLAARCTAFLLGDSLLLLAPVSRKGGAADLQVAPSVASHLERHDGNPARASTPPRITRISTAYNATELPPGNGDDTVVDAEARLVLDVWSSECRVQLLVQESWLGPGILLGRNPEKCSHEALAEVLANEHVSRCHVFLRREHDAVVFYDTASTSGLCVDDELVPRVVIPAPRAALELPVPDYAAVNPAGTTMSLTDDVFVTLYAIGDPRSASCATSARGR